MKQSLRRIANTLLGVGVLALTLTTAYSLVGFCEDNTCLTAGITFGIVAEPTFPEANTATAITTTQDGEGVPSMTEFLMTFFTATSTYLIFIAVMILVVLECMELYYIRQLLKKGKGRKFIFFKV